MRLNRPNGNMYWWAWTSNPYAMVCCWECLYCYVSNSIAPMLKRMGNTKYSGETYLIEKELETPIKKPDDGKVIFVQSCGDICCPSITDEWNLRVLDHCCDYPQYEYLFQSKNPARFITYLNRFPPKTILGTTIESNRWATLKDITRAPDIGSRSEALKLLKKYHKTMVSIEPIIDFDLNQFVKIIRHMNVDFVSIGADSKGILKKHGIPEPPAWKVEQLIKELREFTEVRVKENLKRLCEVKNE